MSAILSCEYLISPAICSPNEIDARVEDLLVISENINNKTLIPFIEENAIDTLVENNNYPCDRVFNENISKCTDNIYSGNDIAKVVNSILQKSSGFYCQDKFCSEVDNLTITPYPFDETGRLDQTIIDMAIYLSLDLGEFHLVHFNKKNITEVKINADISTIISDTLDTSSLSKLDNQINIPSSYKHYLSLMNGFPIYSSSQGELDLKLAIYIGALKLKREMGENYQDFSWDSFEVGDEFWASLHEHECLQTKKYASTAFDVICHLVANHPKNDINPFYELNNPEKQRERNGMKAWRTHVTKSGAALRLMYWQLPSGTIKLANVANKNDLVIR
ncbi:hypothetical protein [Aeromonas jandaei]|uniref:hypothetical protein n=1 Tax=Aeromonas jandaei TaxID=650 RepID=UPI003B9ED6CE